MWTPVLHPEIIALRMAVAPGAAIILFTLAGTFALFHSSALPLLCSKLLNLKAWKNVLKTATTHLTNPVPEHLRPANIVLSSPWSIFDTHVSFRPVK